MREQNTTRIPLRRVHKNKFRLKGTASFGNKRRWQNSRAASIGKSDKSFSRLSKRRLVLKALKHQSNLWFQHPFCKGIRPWMYWSFSLLFLCKSARCFYVWEGRVSYLCISYVNSSDVSLGTRLFYTSGNTVIHDQPAGDAEVRFLQTCNYVQATEQAIRNREQLISQEYWKNNALLTRMYACTHHNWMVGKKTRGTGIYS